MISVTCKEFICLICEKYLAMQKKNFNNLVEKQAKEEQ